jgi:uncharacterized protein YqeY
MSIEEALGEKFKAAMRARDERTLDVIRMVRTEFKKAITAEGFTGEAGEETWREVISVYVRNLQKAIPEFEAGGERGKEMIEKLVFEIEFLKPFLPGVMDEAATEDLVRQAIAALGAASPKMAGRVVGAVMKEHKGSVDAALVKRLAEKLLGGAQ